MVAGTRRGGDPGTCSSSKRNRASYMLGYLPKAWRGVKVVFIPKAETKDPEQHKSYRPISLTSFLLKTMEKLIDLHIRSKCLVRHPLHKMQFTYQTGYCIGSSSSCYQD
jgi:hypothetical protein